MHTLLVILGGFLLLALMVFGARSMDRAFKPILPLYLLVFSIIQLSH